MKTVLITGATSGIGRATARTFAKNNYKVILCGRREDRLAELQDELLQRTEVHTLLFDVRNKKEVQKSIDSLPADFADIDICLETSSYSSAFQGFQRVKENILFYAYFSIKVDV